MVIVILPVQPFTGSSKDHYYRQSFIHLHALEFIPGFRSVLYLFPTGKRPEWIENKWKFVVVIAVWLLFLPNSFYIITDLFHLEFQEGSSRWFDLTLIFSFAWNGLLLGILSIRQIEKIFRHCFQYKNEFLFLLPVMWLNAWGIYIGRFMRFNSWDILTNPFELFADIGYMLIHPFRNIYPWSMIMVFAIFMTIIYMSVKRMAKVI